MTERNEPADPRHEEALAAALHAHAESVRPAGDGLIQIRARVERRRVRHRFLVPVATSAAVAATVTAVVASGMLAGSSPKSTVQALPTTALTAATKTTTKPAPTTTPAAKVSTAIASPHASTAAVAPTSTAPAASTPALTTFVAATRIPPGPSPVWPFKDAAAAASWAAHAASGTDAWHLDATQTVKQFIATLKLTSDPLTVTPHTDETTGTGTIDVSRVSSTTGKPIALATVSVSKWVTGAGQPWGVDSVTSTAGSAVPMTVTSPTANATVGAPLAVSFSLTGPEDAVTASAFVAGSSSAVASKTVPAGGQTITLDSGLPTTGRGFVVVADKSSAGDLSRLAVTPVQFAASATPSATSYVAVIAGQLHVFDAATDTQSRPLAGDATGVTQVAVSDDRQWVYYLQGAGQVCGGGTLMRTRLDGTGTPTKVDTGAGPVTVFGISGPHAEQLAYATTPCATDQIVHWQTATASGQITGFPKPPLAESLALSPDGKTLTGYVRISTEGNVYNFGLPAAHTLADGTVPATCGTVGTGCISATYAADGDLLLVTGDGQQLTVWRQHAGETKQLFHVAGAYGGSLDVDPTGTKVLLTDGTGLAWSWATGGKPTKLPTGITDASW